MDQQPVPTDQQLVPLDLRAQAEVERLKLQLVKSNGDALSPSTSQKPKKQVLEEDDFVNRIGSIIEKDFFPDVTKLRYELEYRDALEKNDYDKLHQLGQQKLEANQRLLPCDTPAAFETPMNFDADFDIIKEDKRKNVLEEKAKVESESMSLNKFLNKFTSEDNASFEQLQEEATRKHLEKVAFLTNDTRQHNERIQNALTLPSIETQAIAKASNSTDQSGDRLVSWKYSNKNSVMFDPDGVPFTKEEADKMKCGKTIVHENTRFKSKPFSSHPLHASANLPDKTLNALKHGKVGVDGKELTASNTPTVNGFKFVPSTPSLAPEMLPDSPLMTWGEIECTPMNIRSDATPLSRPDLTPSAHFKIPDVSQREKIGQELANRILTKRKREQASNRLAAISESPYRSGFERLNSMSPAAQLLATKKLGLHSSMDRSLQASYSPLTSSFRSQTPTPKHVVTPSPLSKSNPSANKATFPASTDKRATSYQSNFGSLKRSKASEFF